MNIKDSAELIISACTLITIVIMFYRTFRDPDIKADNEIGLIKQGCILKHQGIDQQISQINKNLLFMRENHINHMEIDIKNLQLGQERIITILDERLPKKNV